MAPNQRLGKFLLLWILNITKGFKEQCLDVIIISYDNVLVSLGWCTVSKLRKHWLWLLLAKESTRAHFIKLVMTFKTSIDCIPLQSVIPILFGDICKCCYHSGLNWLLVLFGKLGCLHLKYWFFSQKNQHSLEDASQYRGKDNNWV